MQRFISACMMLVCLLAIEAFAQMDWGTDAGSYIIINAPAGAVDTVGEGELVLGGHSEVDTVPDTTTVTAVYNLGPLVNGLDEQVAPGDTVWYYYDILNMGNGPDSILISVDTLANINQFGQVMIVEDINGDSIWTSGTDNIRGGNGQVSIGLAEDAKFGLLVGVIVPGAANAADVANVEVTIEGNNKTGADDLWPANYPWYTANVTSDNGDAFTDTVVLTVGMPVIHFLSQVDKANAAPGDTLLYTITYDNDGNDSTVAAQGGNLLVRQNLPAYVLWLNQLGTAAVHNATGMATQYSSIAAPGVFNQNGTWATSYPDSVAGFEIGFGVDIAADDNSETTDNPGAADGEFPDVDAGQITFKVIVK